MQPASHYAPGLMHFVASISGGGDDDDGVAVIESDAQLKCQWRTQLIDNNHSK